MLNLIPDLKGGVHEQVMKTCFKVFFEMTDTMVCHRLIGHMLARRIGGLTFRIGRRSATLKPIDVSMILQLPLHDGFLVGRKSSQRTKGPTFQERMFPGVRVSKITVKIIKEKFDNKKLKVNDRARLALLYCIAVFLLPRPGDVVDGKFWAMMDESNLATFDAYPWARDVYNALWNGVSNAYEDREERKDRYNLFGCGAVL